MRPIVLVRSAAWVLALTLGLPAGTSAQSPPSPAEGAEKPEGRQAPNRRPPSAAIRKGALVITAPDGSTQTLDPGCEPQELLQHDKRLYVACGADGVVVLDVSDPRSPRTLARKSTMGEANGLFERGGRVWVEIEHVEAQPVRDLVETAASEIQESPRPRRAAASPEPRDRARRPTGRVLEVEPGSVVVDLGSNHGLSLRDRIELFDREERTLATRRIMRDHTLAVGQVEELASDRARVRLGFAERVPPNTLARPTSRPTTADRWAPPRVGGLFSLQGVVRPYVPLGDVGFGMLGEAAVTYRGERDWFLRAHIESAGFGVGKEDSAIGVFSGYGIAGYDHRLFGIGVGAGGMQVNDVTYDIDGTQFGLTLAQNVRLGAVDGGHVEVTTTFVLVDTVDSSSTSVNREFKWGSVLASGQIPIAEGLWLVARGGGGRPGHIFFDAGLRIAVSGNGGHGSIFLTPTLGAIWLVHDPTSDYSDHVGRDGPSVGLGIEWRP